MRWDGRTRVAAVCLGAAVTLSAGFVATRNHPGVAHGAAMALRRAAPMPTLAANTGSLGGRAAASGRAAAFAPIAGAGGAPAPAALNTFAGTAVESASVGATGGGGGSGGTTSGGSGLGDVVTRRVEQNAQLTVRVKDVGQAFNAAGALAATFGGYVESSNLNAGGGTGQEDATLVLAVPQAQFGACLKQVEALGTVANTTISGQDVTQQYVDLQGRIDALTAERQSYLTLLGKATAIGDILQIQNGLTDVQSQIENLTGQLRVLDDLSAMARVNVNLLPVAAVQPVPRQTPAAIRRVAAALQASARALADGATALAEAVAWVLPWVALGGLGWLVYRRVVSRVRA